MTTSDPASAYRRPWPLPRRPWVMAQRWEEVLLMHWSLPAAVLRGRLPPGLTLDTFAGEAWLSIVPFRMLGVRPRGVPPVPWLSAFPELNIRTYVTAGNKPGVYFFSLDAANPVAVSVARHWTNLPYFRAAMSTHWENGWIHYRSRRTHAGAPPAALRMRYQPTGVATVAEPGTRAAWLTSRYCFYVDDIHGRITRLEVDHAPWSLQPAACEIKHNTMTTPLAIDLPEQPALLHYARALDVRTWQPARIRA